MNKNFFLLLNFSYFQPFFLFPTNLKKFSTKKPFCSSNQKDININNQMLCSKNFSIDQKIFFHGTKKASFLFYFIAHKTFRAFLLVPLPAFLFKKKEKFSDKKINMKNAECYSFFFFLTKGPIPYCECSKKIPG